MESDNTDVAAGAAAEPAAAAAAVEVTETPISSKRLIQNTELFPKKVSDLLLVFLDYLAFNRQTEEQSELVDQYIFSVPKEMENVKIIFEEIDNSLLYRFMNLIEVKYKVSFLFKNLILLRDVEDDDRRRIELFREPILTLHDQEKRFAILLNTFSEEYEQDSIKELHKYFLNSKKQAPVSQTPVYIEEDVDGAEGWKRYAYGNIEYYYNINNSIFSNTMPLPTGETLTDIINSENWKIYTDVNNNQAYEYNDETYHLTSWNLPGTQGDNTSIGHISPPGKKKTLKALARFITGLQGKKPPASVGPSPEGPAGTGPALAETPSGIGSTTGPALAETPSENEYTTGPSLMTMPSEIGDTTGPSLIRMPSGIGSTTGPSLMTMPSEIGDTTGPPLAETSSEIGSTTGPALRRVPSEIGDTTGPALAGPALAGPPLFRSSTGEEPETAEVPLAAGVTPPTVPRRVFGGAYVVPPLTKEDKDRISSDRRQKDRIRVVTDLNKLYNDNKSNRNRRRVGPTTGEEAEQRLQEVDFIMEQWKNIVDTYERDYRGIFEKGPSEEPSNITINNIRTKLTELLNSIKTYIQKNQSASKAAGIIEGIERTLTLINNTRLGELIPVNTFGIVQNFINNLEYIDGSQTPAKKTGSIAYKRQTRRQNHKKSNKKSKTRKHNH